MMRKMQATRVESMSAIVGHIARMSPSSRVIFGAPVDVSPTSRHGLPSFDRTVRSSRPNGLSCHVSLIILLAALVGSVYR
jgi:hypothetical protein